jgi:Putative transposase of IS4/5 family (DUF4096)
METKQAHKDWRIPDELWERMQLLLPKYERRKKGGRPRLDLRKVVNGIFNVLRTGCQCVPIGIVPSGANTHDRWSIIMFSGPRVRGHEIYSH